MRGRRAGNFQCTLPGSRIQDVPAKTSGAEITQCFQCTLPGSNIQDVSAKTSGAEITQCCGTLVYYVSCYLMMWISGLLRVMLSDDVDLDLLRNG